MCAKLCAPTRAHSNTMGTEPEVSSTGSVPFPSKAPGANCAACPWKAQPIVPHLVPGDVDFVIQGESPGQEEALKGEPFVGPSGRLSDQELVKVGLSRSRALICNTAACRPPKDATEKSYEAAVRCCSGYLKQTLAGHENKPRLCYGDWASWQATGHTSIMNWYGYPLPRIERTIETTVKKSGKIVEKEVCTPVGGEPKIMPCLHPAFILREPAWLEEFQTTLKRFADMVKGAFRVWEPPIIEISEDPGRVLTALRSLSQTGQLSCDTETAGTNGLFVRMLCLSVADAERTVCFDWPPAPEVYAELKHRLEGGQTIVFHNRQHDTLVLTKAGISMKHVECSMNKHVALYPGIWHRLSVAAVSHTPAPRWKSEFHDEGEHKGADLFTFADPEKRRRYCAMDSWHGWHVDNQANKLLAEDPAAKEIYAQLEEQTEIAMHMRTAGLRFNTAFADARLARFQGRAERIRKVFASLVAKSRIPDVDLGSEATTGSVRSLLLGHFKLGIPPGVDRRGAKEWKTDSGQLSFGKWTVQMWGAGHGNGSELSRFVCRQIYHYRRATHTQGMINSLRKAVSPDGRLHPAYNPGGALTGRWACNDPNLMNLPKLGQFNLRPLCMADEGCCLVAADGDKAELRAVAYDANDLPLLQAFESGVDVHMANAIDLYGDKLLTKSKLEQKKCRDLAKRLVFNFNYGGAPETAHHALAPTHPELQVKHLIYLQAAWFRKHPAILAYQHRLVDTARREHVIRSPLGLRREFFPYGLVDPNKVYNFPAQSMIAEVIRRAMVKLHNDGWDLRINEHDELVLNVPYAKRYAAARALDEAISMPFELHGKVRNIPTECSMGNTWGQLMSPKEFDKQLLSQGVPLEVVYPVDNPNRPGAHPSQASATSTGV